MLLPKRWQSCMMLLVFVLSDGTGTTKRSRAATAAVCGKDLQPRSRVLMGFASLADTMNASGLVFCVANPSADANALRNGLDWACGPGAANCTAIQPGQPCYEPNNLTALASYAYNEYYQRTRASGGSCSFNNTAMTTTSDPSHGSCIFTGSAGGTTNTNTTTSPSPTTTPSSGGSPGSNNFVPLGSNIDRASSASRALQVVACLLPLLCSFRCGM
ncbi:unnamed protein product [Musa acuminata subsp. burmannicoides]|uniref:(wild Malaysian banana) hypothetical protein n=1 Tax=Musa acuminata subsp. malaccensis TaxID=214687 RepID=A0A804II58_MUSAM|nr:PREDICTED: glucan endo-1,3-beta-glucosidase 4-like isoform X1 [Musa acuminata subsp. malaccensis]XP_009394430.1 PREDICTED: glucan endo-1,3-beta-glucosidase 4-like isoform X1 [Musa acuminata subsp. malaccensis]CAG1851772.1 unnamed protein product [Musa acuminata subsp. malaccensis]